MDKYDIALWRPCTYEQYVDHLAHLIYTPGEPTTLTTEVEQLPDGRFRYVTTAEVMGDEPGDSRFEPYLMIIAEAMTDHVTAKPRCFVSTAELAIG